MKRNSPFVVSYIQQFVLCLQQDILNMSSNWELFTYSFKTCHKHHELLKFKVGFLLTHKK